MSINGLPFAPPIFRGDFVGDSHWGAVHWTVETDEGPKTVTGPVDFSDRKMTSTPSGDKEVRFPIYQYKPCGASFFISAMCIGIPILVMLFVSGKLLPETENFLSHLRPDIQITIIVSVSVGAYLGLSIAYNVARIGGLAVYLFFHMFVDMARQKKIVKPAIAHGRAFVDQVRLSIQDIVRGFFYAPLYSLGHVYTLFSPLNGRKWVAQIENAWNHGVGVINSFSILCLCGLVDEGAMFEGNGDLDKLGTKGFYLTRCYQPVAWLVYDADKLGDKSPQEVQPSRVDSAYHKNSSHSVGRFFENYPKTCTLVPAGC